MLSPKSSEHQETPTLSIGDIISLLVLCLNTTFFKLRGVIYKQIFGTAMGSSVPVVVASLIMEDVKQQVLKSFCTSLRFWKRSATDVYTSLRGDLILPLLQHLNTIEPLI